MTMTNLTATQASAGAIASCIAASTVALAGTAASAAPIVAFEERTPEQQAYPRRLGAGWQISPGNITELMRSYLQRSLPMIHAGSKPAEAAPIPRTAQGIAGAIELISALHGMHVSIDSPLPFTLPAWQGASHLYAISRDPRVPLKLIPIYGAMLCMSRNRLELLSLLSLRPLPKDGLNVAIDAKASELIAAIRTIEPDLFFEDIVKSGLAYSLCRHIGCGCGKPTVHVIERWIDGFTKLFSVDAEKRSIVQLLSQADAEGRGGALANEASFQRERDLFLNGNVTGVSLPTLGASMDAVELDMRVRGLAHDVVHVHGSPVNAQVAARLRLLPKRSPAMLLQTASDVFRAFQGEEEWLGALSAKGAPERSLKMREVLNLRSAVAHLIKTPARNPLRTLSQDVHVDPKLRNAIKYLQRAQDDAPLSRDDAHEILKARSTGLGDDYSPLDREMILNTLSGLVSFLK